MRPKVGRNLSGHPVAETGLNDAKRPSMVE
jgi:hypothetical protein